MPDSLTASSKPLASLLPDLPLVLWMVLASLALGLAGGLSAAELVASYNTGFGRALGEFALILLPAFALAAATARHPASQTAGVATAAAPLAGAGMICPDTAYAALSPIAGRQKIDVAFGAYAGFKLLYPAGPLIVATGLGVAETSLAVWGAILLLPVWACGAIWARGFGALPVAEGLEHVAGASWRAMRPLVTFAVLALLLGIGTLLDLSPAPLLNFMTQPKGALIVAAILALLDVPSAQRRDCLDSAVRRTGSLLLVIGAASAFGAMLTLIVPLDGVFESNGGVQAILALFALTAVFKLAQGSSMATFVAVAPVAAPLVASSGLPPTAAVYAICLGSFVAILPNDSYYWLVRRDALAHLTSDGRAIWILSGGATLQALVGLPIIATAVVAGVI